MRTILFLPVLLAAAVASFGSANAQGFFYEDPYVDAPFVTAPGPIMVPAAPVMTPGVVVIHRAPVLARAPVLVLVHRSWPQNPSSWRLRFACTPTDIADSTIRDRPAVARPATAGLGLQGVRRDHLILWQGCC